MFWRTSMRELTLLTGRRLSNNFCGRCNFCGWTFLTGNPTFYNKSFNLMLLCAHLTLQFNWRLYDHLFNNLSMCIFYNGGIFFNWRDKFINFFFLMNWELEMILIFKIYTEIFLFFLNFLNSLIRWSFRIFSGSFLLLFILFILPRAFINILFFLVFFLGGWGMFTLRLWVSAFFGLFDFWILHHFISNDLLLFIASATLVTIIVGVRFRLRLIGLAWIIILIFRK